MTTTFFTRNVSTRMRPLQVCFDHSMPWEECFDVPECTDWSFNELRTFRLAKKQEEGILRCDSYGSWTTYVIGPPGTIESGLLQAANETRSAVAALENSRVTYRDLYSTVGFASLALVVAFASFWQWVRRV